MPPRKKTEEKEKPTAKTTDKVPSKAADKPAAKTTASEAADMIMEYLRRENRPYSANDVSANLHNKVTKAAAAKILKDLHERNEIEGRAAGKQIVYHPIQSPTSTLPPQTLTSLTSRTLSLTTQTTTLTTRIKALRSTLASLTSTLSTAELRSGVAAMEEEKVEIERRLGELRKGGGEGDGGVKKKVGKREREDVGREWEVWKGVSGRRKRIRGEMWGVVEGVVEDGEGGEGVKEEVWEAVGMDE